MAVAVESNESNDGGAEAIDPPRNAEEALTTVSDSLWMMWENFLLHLPLLALGLVVLLLTWCAAAITQKVVSSIGRRARLRRSLRDLLLQIAGVAVWILGVTIAAVIVFPGMTPTKILTVLGLSSIAIGFAFKDIVENFFAGVLILWRFPFSSGDFVECNGIQGKVEETTIRMTMIRQVDGQLVIVPNAMLFKNPVNVLTSESTRRTTIICGVAYGEDVDHAREVIEVAVSNCQTVESNKAVEIFAQEFGASSINFEVTWWTKSTPLDIRRSRDEVISAVKRALDDADIEIPFPYRTLTFKDPLIVDNNDAVVHEDDSE